MSPPSDSRPVVDRDTLVAYLDTFLRTDEGSDHSPNGLQVEGSPQVTRIVCGVSACEELFQRAREAEANAVVVHHGLFWHGDSPVLTGVQFRRVAELIRGDLNLLAYHLPLDRHSEVGNNAVAARALGLTETEAFCQYEGLPVGCQGRLAQTTELASVVTDLANLYGQDPVVFAHGPETVSTVGLVSGAGGRCFHQAIAQRLDLFITGEAEEWSMNLARDAGANFVAAGHHATERLGIRALGEHLEHHFGIEAVFIDIPNPI